MNMSSYLDYVIKPIQILWYFCYLLVLTGYEKILKIIFNTPTDKIRIRPIIWHLKLDPEEISRQTDFLLLPGTLGDIDVLDNPNWHLYCIDEEKVTFVLLKFPISHYCIANFPFMYEPIHHDAIVAAEMSHSTFKTFAKQLEKKPQPKTVLFTNTARCGSTLMAKMLNHPGKSICFGEPHALSNLAILDKEQLVPSDQIKELLSATVTCLRTYTPVDEICVLKTTSAEALLVQYCKDITNLKHIFMFRKNGLPSVEKCIRREEAMTWYLLNAYLINPDCTRFVSNLMAMEAELVRVCKPENLRQYAAIVYASPLSAYEKNKDMYCHPIIWHHDIINNTEETLTNLFKDIDIPLDCVPAAIDCKKEDSQKDSFLSVDKLQHIKIEPLSDEDYCKMHTFAVKMKISGSVFDDRESQ